MREQVAGAPAAAGLLVGHRGQRHPSAEPVAVLVQQRIDNAGRDGAAFHVGRSATIEAFVLDGAAPGASVFPASRIAGRKDVDMAVQHEMRAGMGTGETADQVRHLRHRGDRAERQAAFAQKRLQVLRPRPRVARRVRGRHLHEPLQQAHERFLGLGDVAQQIVGDVVHRLLSVTPQAGASSVARKQAARCPGSTSARSGSARSQSATASAQRGWKRQPAPIARAPPASSFGGGANLHRVGRAGHAAYDLSHVPGRLAALRSSSACSAKWQATSRPASAASGGVTDRQTGCVKGQRSAKLQPG